MILREDVLSIKYLEKSEFTGCHQGMRYRLEMKKDEEGQKSLQCCIWPEPFNYFNTSEEQKQYADFTFDEDGVCDAVRWMNDRIFQGNI